MKKSHSRGFTLIELLVVIAIIALLTGIVMTNLSSSKGKARDAKRISDIGQMQLAIELFFDRCKQFPFSNGTDLDIDSTCTISTNTIHLTDYLPKLPLPPAGSTYDYFVNPQWTEYFLHVTLESANEAVRDGLHTVPTSWYNSDGDFPTPLVTCDDASGSKEYCLSSR